MKEALAGALAAMTSKTGTIGFIGGSDADVIKRFKKGYLKGAESVKPNIRVLSEISGTFDDDKLGKRIAQNMIRKSRCPVYGGRLHGCRRTERSGGAKSIRHRC